MATEEPEGSPSTVTCVRGESFAVSSMTGDVLRGGDQGVYVRDTRFLDVLEVLVDGHRLRPLVGSGIGPTGAVFHAWAPLEGQGPDPTVLVERRRQIDGSLHESVRVTNHGRRPLDLELGVRAGTDFAYIFDVRHGRSLEAAVPEHAEHGLRFARPGGVERAVLLMDPAPDRHDADTMFLTGHLTPGQSLDLHLDLVITDVYGTIHPSQRVHDPLLPAAEPAAHGLTIRCSDHRFARLVEQSLIDIDALKTNDPQAPQDQFCAAGSPWYLTLFGRDSLWTAFMAAPFDKDLAGGTLRTLARRQGRRDDPDTEEAPGKILHEIRRGSLTHRGDLPPNYYGTIDATPLFVVLAHEAWRWGMPDLQVGELLPAVERALQWMPLRGDTQEAFLAYRKTGERGLDNQGWKDSHDGVQFADGTLAQPPIALAEVQGYAHDAARRGAELLERFNRPGASDWRDAAQRLATRFREAFWLVDDVGPYPAIALDRDGKPVDGPASNMGHLLATGLLDAAEARHVAAQLGHPRLASGWGLRTMATTNARFNPLGYHTGSVWPHDTAISVWGLAVTGQRDAAVSLLHALVDASPRFGYRLPELFGGHGRVEAPIPVPYPASCLPQAWAAGGALLLLRACLGLHPNVPDGHLAIAPLWPPPFGNLEVEGIPVAGGRLDVRVDARLGVEAELHGASLRLDVATAHA